MKKSNSPIKGIGFLVLLFLTSLAPCPAANSNDGAPDGEMKEDFRIRVGVEEVRLDAVVLDGKGRQVTDLTADDFEIRLDGKNQEITSCIYINEYSPRTAVPDRDSKDAGTVPALPPPMPEREGIRRMIGFVVDSLGMSFEEVHFARTALKRFVDSQMQPGDVVAVVQTAQGSAAYQLFSHDREYLHKAIEKIRWYLNPDILEHAATEYMAIDYFIEAMRDMPGRKALIVMSPAVKRENALKLQFQNWRPVNVPITSRESALNLLADKALRAGVVIHTMDVTGLKGPDFIDVTRSAELAADDTFSPGEGVEDTVSEWDRILLNSKINNSLASSSLSLKTGGLIVSGTNWFFRGIGPVHEALKGYYILTFIPPESAFRTGYRGAIAYHRIRIKVNRPGLEVHTRDGFYGADSLPDDSTERPPTVRDALYSPFRNTGLAVNLFSGYVDDPQKGYTLRLHMHLDGKKLSIVEGKDGIYSVYADLACRTYSMGGFTRDPGNLQYEFRIKAENIPWIRKYGLRFSLDLPVKKPGAYYVRAAVQDRINGKAGSAYQYIEIPDLKDDRPVLSNVFIISRDEDAPWSPVQTPEEFRNLLYPDMRKDPRKSPAIRSFLPGESFDYAAFAYNMKNRKGEKPDLESWSVLYGNGKELYKSEPTAVDLAGVTDFNRIPIRKRLSLGNSIEPGDYILALYIKDNRAKEKRATAVQALDFRVLSEAEPGGTEKTGIVEHKELPLSPEVLAQYTGTYKLGPGSHAAVTLEDGRLYVQVTGQPKLPLYPESETKFFHKALSDAENEFLKDDRGAVTHMIVRKGDSEIKAPRISDTVVERREIPLPPGTLEQYAGIYELGSGIDMIITLENGRLYSRIPGQRMLRLCPETENRFFFDEIADAGIEFTKDEKGKVTHLTFRREERETVARRTKRKSK